MVARGGSSRLAAVQSRPDDYPIWHRGGLDPRDAGPDAGRRNEAGSTLQFCHHRPGTKEVARRYTCNLENIYERNRALFTFA